MKEYVGHLLPAVFCTFLCLMALAMPSTIIFFSFLPLCFVFVGIVTYSLLRQIRELKAELAALRAQQTR
jgi:hypothetical protein